MTMNTVGKCQVKKIMWAFQKIIICRKDCFYVTWKSFTLYLNDNIEKSKLVFQNFVYFAQSAVTIGASGSQSVCVSALSTGIWI